MTAAEWEALRDTRLRALADAPDAFGTTHAEAVARPELWWRDWAERSASGADQAMFLAWDGDRAVGIAGAFRDESHYQVISMWTDPQQRGRGIGRALLEAAVAYGGDEEIRLSVTDGNDSARQLYERCGIRRYRGHGAAALERGALHARAPPGAMRELDERIERATGSAPVEYRRAAGGYSSADRFVVTLSDGRQIFVKSAEAEHMAAWLRREHEVYAALAGTFIPQLEGWDDDGVRPLLAIEDLSGADWAPNWDDRRIDAVRAALAELGAAAAPRTRGR